MKLNRLMIAMLFSGSVLMACNNEANDNDEMGDSTMMDNTTTDNAMVSDDAKDFATTAASGGMMEVELGQMAQQNGMSTEVKNFGKMMVDDHTKANEELKAIAANKNMMLPESLKEKHAEHVKEVGVKRGKEFDKAYMDLMVNDHEEDVKMFEDAANNLTDPELKAFAAKTVPVLRQHLEKAKSIHQSMQ